MRSNSCSARSRTSPNSLRSAATTAIAFRENALDIRGDTDTLPRLRQLGGRLGALQERQFRLLWLGRVSSSAGDSLIGVALAFGGLSVSGSPFDLGLVLAAFTISRVALTLVGGVYADRLPRREVMLVCDGVRAIVEAFTAGMLLTGRM